MYRIGISGSYGGMNLGDEAILHVIMRELRNRLPVSITVFSLNPQDTQSRHAVEHVAAVRQLSRKQLAQEIGELDLFILGGGGILFDAEALAFLRGVQIAQELGIPVMTWAIGVGPLNDRHVQTVVQQTLSAVNLLTVRDERSRLLLEEIEVTREIHVTADPGLLLEPEAFTEEMRAQEGIPPDSRIIGLSIREPGPAAPDLTVEHYHDLLANTVDYLIDRVDATVLFIPMERRQDMQQAHAVAARAANVDRTLILKGNYTSRQILGLMNHLTFAIGMRLHFLIFASVAGVPFVPLPYSSKVSEFVDQLGFTVASIQATTSGQLLAHIDRSWDLQAILRERLARNIPPLVERAEQTAILAVDLLRSLT